MQRLFDTHSNVVDTMPINQHIVKQFLVSQMDEDVSQYLSCHDEKFYVKKDITAIDVLTMEKVDLLCDGDITQQPEMKTGTDDLIRCGKKSKPPVVNDHGKVNANDNKSSFAEPMTF